jgi:hypothetical protein
LGCSLETLPAGRQLDKTCLKTHWFRVKKTGEEDKKKYKPPSEIFTFNSIRIIRSLLAFYRY